MSYSEKIKILRKYLNTSNTGIEKFLGLSNGYISNIEKNGTDNPGKLLVALKNKGISTDWFLSGSEDAIAKTSQQDDRVVYDAQSQISQQDGPNGDGPKEEYGVKNNPFAGILFSNKEVVFHPKNSLQSVETGSTLEAMPEKGGLPDNMNISAEKGGIAAVSERTEAASEAIKRRLPVIVEGGETGVLIPVIGQGLSAGFGFDYDEGEVVRFIKIPAWIARKSRDLVALPIYGDSMEPTIGRGDLAVCDSNGFKDDGIYALRDEDRGLMFCKRVVWDPEGWEIISDNSRYKGKIISRNSLQIIGRVIAAVKEVK